MTSILVTVLAVAATAEGGWEVARDDGHTVVERRPVEDGFMEIRASSTTDLPAHAIADMFWNRRVRGVSAVKKYEVLKHDDKEKIAYTQLKLPVVKDRDYTVHMQRYADEANGLYQFTSVCESDKGPPENPEHVRVKRCRATMTIEREADGRTRVSYTTFADTAGRIPKWIVNMLAPKAASEFMERLLEETKGVMASR